MFFKSFQIGGIPIHKIRDSGLFPAINVMAKVWQKHAKAKCPFQASRLWPRECVIGVAFATFFSITAVNHWPGLTCFVSLILLSLESLRIMAKHTSLDVENAEKFVRLLQELDEELISESGLSCLSATHDNDEMKKLLKKELAELAYMVIFCEHKQKENASMWRDKRNCFSRISLKLGFDLGSYESYHRVAEERYQRENSTQSFSPIPATS